MTGALGLGTAFITLLSPQPDTEPTPTAPLWGQLPPAPRGTAPWPPPHPAGRTPWEAPSPPQGGTPSHKPLGGHKWPRPPPQEGPHSPDPLPASRPLTAARWRRARGRRAHHVTLPPPAPPAPPASSVPRMRGPFRGRGGDAASARRQDGGALCLGRVTGGAVRPRPAPAWQVGRGRRGGDTGGSGGLSGAGGGRGERSGPVLWEGAGVEVPRTPQGGPRGVSAPGRPGGGRGKNGEK